MSEPWYTRAFDAVYLEVYAHRSVAEAEQVTRDLLAPLGLRGARVLDLACGAGRYTRVLAEHGARSVGLDLSTALLEAAHAHVGRAAALVRGDMLHLPFRSRSFDLVVSMFTSFGYFARPEQDRAVLSEARRALRDEGALFLDLLNPEHLRRTLVPQSHRRAGRYRVFERRHIDSANRVVKQIEVRDGDRVNTYREVVRLWTRAELEAALEAAGMRVESVWGGYDAAPYSAGRSERLLVLARSTAASG